MAKALDMVIRHSLGRAAARKRLEDGLGYALAQVGPYASKTTHSWTGDDLAFTVTALGVTATGTASVQDSAVVIHAQLPFLLAPFASSIRGYVEGNGQTYFDEA